MDEKFSKCYESEKWGIGRYQVTGRRPGHFVERPREERRFCLCCNARLWIAHAGDAR